MPLILCANQGCVCDPFTTILRRPFYKRFPAVEGLRWEDLMCFAIGLPFLG
jgi:hypothetical protein